MRLEQAAASLKPHGSLKLAAFVHNILQINMLQSQSMQTQQTADY